MVNLSSEQQKMLSLPQCQPELSRQHPSVNTRAPRGEDAPRGSSAPLEETKLVDAAIVGAGYIAEYHLAAVRRLKHVNVVGACDPDAGRLDRLCEQWSILHRAASLSELLGRCEPRVVHLLVPPPLHFKLAKEALQAGLHVLIEKPMALASEECKELIALARPRRLTIGVNHNALHHPMFCRLLRDLACCKLGKVEHVTVLQNLPLAQLHSGEHDHWMFGQAQNVLFEQGPHPLSQICALLGPVRRIQTSCSGKKELRTGSTFYGSWQLAMTCERGTAQLHMAFAGSFPEWWLHVVGQDGSAHLDLLNNTYTLDRRSPSIPPLDAFRRVFRQGRQLAMQAIRGLWRYSLSTLRLTGRSDPYFLSMVGSIEAFYKRIACRDHGSEAAAMGENVVTALEMAAQDIPKPDPILPVSESASASRAGEVLILGGTGFIGRRLVAALHQAGYPIRLMVRRPSLLPTELKRFRPNVFTGDIRNREDIDRAIAGCQAVIHMVAGAPTGWAGFQELFVEGTRNVAEACLKWKVPKLLYVSSIAAHYLGKRRITVTEETPLDAYPHRRCDYSRAKILCEHLLRDMYRTHKLPVAIFRPGIVVGQGGSPEHLGVGMWLGPTQCIGWGRRSTPLPFVLVDDVVLALVHGLRLSGLEGKAFNLVGDVRLTAAEYVEALRRESRRDIRFHRRSILGWRALEFISWAIKAIGRKSDNRAMSWRELLYRTGASQLECAFTKKVLGWQPVRDRDTFIEFGIRRSLEEHL